eukprot:c20809_g2_i1 orf=379-816(+)
MATPAYLLFYRCLFVNAKFPPRKIKCCNLDLCAILHPQEHKVNPICSQEKGILIVFNAVSELHTHTNIRYGSHSQWLCHPSYKTSESAKDSLLTECFQRCKLPFFCPLFLREGQLLPTSKGSIILSNLALLWGDSFEVQRNVYFC